MFDAHVRTPARLLPNGNVLSVTTLADGKAAEPCSDLSPISLFFSFSPTSCFPFSANDRPIFLPFSPTSQPAPSYRLITRSLSSVEFGFCRGNQWNRCAKRRENSYRSCCRARFLFHSEFASFRANYSTRNRSVDGTSRFSRTVRGEKVTREVARYKSKRDRCPLGNHFRGRSALANETNDWPIDFSTRCRATEFPPSVRYL